MSQTLLQFIADFLPGKVGGNRIGRHWSGVPEALHGMAAHLRNLPGLAQVVDAFKQDEGVRNADQFDRFAQKQSGAFGVADVFDQ